MLGISQCLQYLAQMSQSSSIVNIKGQIIINRQQMFNFSNPNNIFSIFCQYPYIIPYIRLYNKLSPMSQPSFRKPWECEICLNPSVYKLLYLCECKHTGICLNCAEKDFISQLQNNQQPKCFTSQCDNATISRDIEGFFRYFELATKEKYDQHLLRRADSRLSYGYCSNSKCDGFIKKNRCSQCSLVHCPLCKKEQHKLNENCPIQSNIVDEFTNTKCPQCGFKFIKQMGCLRLKCTVCKHQYCFKCEKPWSFGHHGCEDYKSLKQIFCRTFCICCLSRPQELQQ